MTISTLGLQQTVFAGVATARDNLEASQIALSSGRRAERYGGLDGDAARLVTAEALEVRSAAALSANDRALARLQLIGGGLESIDARLADLENTLSAALANGDGALVSDAVRDNARAILSTLNQQFGETFLFGGDTNARRPVNASQLADLTGDPATDFSSGNRFAIVIDDRIASSGPTAAEIFAPLIDTLNSLAAIGNTPGTDSALDATARATLTNGIQALGLERQRIQEERALVGVDENRLDRVNARLTAVRDIAEVAAADIEAIDPAEAITRLNQDQLALEASARALGILNDVSLLNFI